MRRLHLSPESPLEFVKSETMNTVPYVFCESVCSVLSELTIYRMNEMSAGRATKYATWNRAARRTCEKRLNVCISIDFRDGLSKYKIEICEMNLNDASTLSFQEFRKLNRQHIHLTNVLIGYQVFGNRTYRTSTLEEITEMFKFTAPFVNSSFMEIRGTPTISEDDLSRLLSLYQNAPFRQIACYSQSRASEQFLIAQMQTNASQMVIAGNGWTEQLRSAIEEFALNKDFLSIDVYCPSLVFGRAFFDALIQKQLFREATDVFGRFSFDARELPTSGFQKIERKYVSKGMRSIRQVSESVSIIRDCKYLSVVLEHPVI